MTDTPTPQQTTAVIAECLGEIEPALRRTIARIVRELGAERALALLDETLQIEANGGMLLPDGSRRRTPGGLFFWLVKERLFQAGEKQIVAKLFWRWQARAGQRAPSAPAPMALRVTWAERGAWLAALGESDIDRSSGAGHRAGGLHVTQNAAQRATAIAPERHLRALLGAFHHCCRHRLRRPLPPCRRAAGAGC